MGGINIAIDVGLDQPVHGDAAQPAHQFGEITGTLSILIIYFTRKFVPDLQPLRESPAHNTPHWLRRYCPNR